MNHNQRQFNADHMSRLRINVEWGFNEVLRKFPFVDFNEQMKVMKIPVACYFITACFITNVRSCLYGNQTMAYFELNPMDLEEYLELPFEH
jgi:hypothetical protein